MMTVRFPNGQTVEYNTAGYVNRQTNFTDIYTKEGGTWIAQVPNTCLIESQSACRVYNAMYRFDDPQFAEVRKELRSIKRKIGSRK